MAVLAVAVLKGGSVKSELRDLSVLETSFSSGRHLASAFSFSHHEISPQEVLIS